MTATEDALKDPAVKALQVDRSCLLAQLAIGMGQCVFYFLLLVI